MFSFRKCMCIMYENPENHTYKDIKWMSSVPKRMQWLLLYVALLLLLLLLSCMCVLTPYIAIVYVYRYVCTYKLTYIPWVHV